MLLATLFFLSLGCPAQAASPSIAPAQFQGLLQGFVNFGYGKDFHQLGDERDFDHGHILLSARTGRPIAILYHTQELAPRPSAARNWIQWLDGKIEDARLYARKDYPRSASWDLFRYQELPRLTRRHTIIDKMLDPKLLGSVLSGSVQWTFTRVECSKRPASDVITVSLPDRTAVCLALRSS